MISMNMLRLVVTVVQIGPWQSQVQIVPLGEFGVPLVPLEGSPDLRNHFPWEIRRMLLQQRHSLQSPGTDKERVFKL